MYLAFKLEFISGFLGTTDLGEFSVHVQLLEIKLLWCHGNPGETLLYYSHSKLFISPQIVRLLRTLIQRDSRRWNFTEHRNCSSFLTYKTVWSHHSGLSPHSSVPKCEIPTHAQAIHCRSTDGVWVPNGKSVGKTLSNVRSSYILWKSMRH